MTKTESRFSSVFVDLIKKLVMQYNFFINFDGNDKIWSCHMKFMLVEVLLRFRANKNNQNGLWCIDICFKIQFKAWVKLFFPVFVLLILR